MPETETDYLAEVLRTRRDQDLPDELPTDVVDQVVRATVEASTEADR